MNNSYDVDEDKGALRESWWKRRSRLEKKLSVFSIIALLLIIILVIVLIIFLTKSPATCLSASCVHTTNKLLEHMNTNVNPCEDFYQFTCGNFIANTQLDGDEEVSTDTLIKDNIHKRVRGIVEEGERDDDLRSIILAKRLYKACMNQSAIERRGLKLIKDSIRQIGGWPVLEEDNWKEKDFDWKLVTYKLRELGYGFEFLIGIDIVADPNNPSKRIIELDMPPNHIYNSPGSDEETLFNYMLNISVIFGADRPRARDDLRAVIDFIKNVIEARNPRREGDLKHDPLTISELQYKFRDIPWLEYINRLQFPSPNVSYDQIVSVTDAFYFAKLQNALRRTPKRVLANYIIWHTILNHGFDLTSEIEDLTMRYLKQMSTIAATINRPTVCSGLVEYTFKLPLQAAYVRKHFPTGSKAHVTEILNSIKDEFRTVVTELKWMDEETRIKALERLSTSNNYVAYSNELLDYDKIERRFVGFQVEEDNLLASVLNVNYYITNQKFEKLHEPVEKDEELDEEYTTMPYPIYNTELNTITLPAGYLQEIIYDKWRPQYLNYGSLGSTIGHLIFHTVFEGKYFKQGTRHYDWTSTQTRLNFNKKLSCVAMHYGKYPVPEIREHLNSSNTKYEDIADMAGLKLAYNAYNKWSSNSAAEQQLPGFDYTPRQMFWIASAIPYCSKNSIEDLEDQLETSTTSPNRYRVIGTLRNSKEFIRDFKCPTNSYMNSEEKCELW